MKTLTSWSTLLLASIAVFVIAKADFVPNIQGNWVRSNLRLTLNQNGNHITGFLPTSNFSHTFNGDWNSGANCFNVEVTRINRTTKQTTVMYERITVKNSNTIHIHTSGTDGHAELPTNFTEDYDWSRWIPPTDQNRRPVPANIVRVQANQNCYFGGTEDRSQAAKGAFGTVYISKGQLYDWKLSGDHKTLYWGAIVTPGSGQPMPRIIQRGAVSGGATLYVP